MEVEEGIAWDGAVNDGRILMETKGYANAVMSARVSVYFLPSAQPPSHIYTQSHLLDHEVVSKCHQKCTPCALGLWGLTLSFSTIAASLLQKKHAYSTSETAWSWRNGKRIRYL